jgi:uncharacterized protein YodC (DUF2158 family)
MNYWLKRKSKLKILVGSVVKDVHTGTLMTVMSITTSAWPWGISNEYTCQWFVGGKLHTQVFLEKSIILEK